MIHHFNCPAVCGNPGITALVFDWDDETGEVTGPSSDEILAAFKDGEVGLNPYPSYHVLASPKNIADIAAIVGWNHRLPPELADYYPKAEGAGWDGVIYGEDGNVVAYAVF